MVSSSTFRWAGVASVTAAGLMLANQLSQFVFALTMSREMAVATHSLRNGLALAAMYTLLIALTGLYAWQASAAGRLGLVGFLLAALGTVLVAGDWWYEAFVAPSIAAQAPEILTTAPTGAILIGAAVTFGSFALGWITFGVSSYRARIFPRGAAILMVAGGGAAVLALAAPFQVPLALAVAWMGVFLLRSVAPDARRPLATLTTTASRESSEAATSG